MRVQLIARTVGVNNEHPETMAGIAAAICTAYQGPVDNALRGALESGHDSVVEHVSFMFLIQGVSRRLLAQLTRHRIASFSVESQRYVKGWAEPIMPQSIASDPELLADWRKLCDASRRFYAQAIARGVPAEDAAFGNLEGSQTQLVMTMDARQLAHFIKLRSCRRAQWQIRELSDKVLQIMKAECPEIFKMVGPGCVRGHCPEGRKSCRNPRNDLMEV